MNLACCNVPAYPFVVRWVEGCSVFQATYCFAGYTLVALQLCVAVELGRQLDLAVLVVCCCRALVC